MFDVISFIMSGGSKIIDLIDVIYDFFERRPGQSLPRYIATLLFRFALVVILPIAVLASCAGFASLPGWAKFVVGTLVAVVYILVLVQIGRAFVKATRTMAAEVKNEAKNAAEKAP